MHIKDVLQDIVKLIPTANIPTKFISAVKLKDSSGKTRVIKDRLQLKDFFQNPHKYESDETRLVIDSEAIHQTIMQEVDDIFAQVEKLQRERFQ